MSRSRSSAWVLLALAGLLAVSFLLPTGTSVEKAVGSHPTVSDGTRSLNNNNLTAATPDRLSGLRDNIVTVRMQGSSPTELLKCDPDGTPADGSVPANRLIYTLNGANATATSSAVLLTCGVPPPPPANVQTYTATLPPGLWSAAPKDVTVTFAFQIFPFGSTMGQIIAEPNTQYKYKLDRTAPIIVDKVPSPVPGSSIPDAVTRNERTAISFRITDDHREAPLNPSSFNITVDGANTVSTRHFDCAVQTPAFNATCTLNYGRLGNTSFKWSVGEHTIVVKANDTTRNSVAAPNQTFKFRVDLTNPNVTAVTAQPQSIATPAPSGGIPTTGRGTKITVGADVSDANMNTKGLNDVFAQLYNTSRNLQSDFVPMKFVSGTRWESPNVTVPNTWPEGIYSVGVRVVAADQGGSLGSNTTGAVVNGQFKARDAFIIDAVPPKIVQKAPPAYIREGSYTVNANITDEGTGLDKTKVKIRFVNLTGQFLSAPSGTTKVGQYHEAPMNNPSGDQFTYTLPPAKDGAIVVYFIVASDKANVTTTTDATTIRADGLPPTLREIDQRDFRGVHSNVFRLEATDAGSGVNHSSVKLLYNFGGGTYRTVSMVREANSTFYRGVANFTGATDGSTLQYFFEASDLVANKASLSTASQPRTAKVDLKPPVSRLQSPATFSGEKFPVTWNATDSGSGVEVFTLEARVQGSSEWIIVLEETTARSLEFCGEGERTYELRVWARDRGGNNETPPAVPMSTTQVTGPGCKEVLSVRVLSPTVGSRIDGRQNSTNILYLASSTSSSTPSRYLKIAVLFSPDDGAHYYALATSQVNNGSYPMSLKGLPSCRVCIVKVQATSLSGIKAEATSVPFEILNGNAQTDLDGNGLPDSWELRYGRSLGIFDPRKDPDGDRLSNVQESQFGTDPNSKDTDGDGASDRAEVRAGFNPLSAQSVPGREATREDEYTNWYWVVPAMFLGTAILFFAGLARRW